MVSSEEEKKQFQILTDDNFHMELGLPLWFDTYLIQDNYIYDCENNYGKNCKYPDRYRNGGCK